MLLCAMFEKRTLQQELDRAGKCADAGDWEGAARHFENATARAPSSAEAWFGVGVACKWLCQWERCISASKRAARLDSRLEGAWWNIGIAATALAQWRVARNAWTKFGVKLEASDEEPRMKLGRVPVRLGNAETVWCERIDPARAIIRNIPTQASGHRHGDLLLHDGEPKGYRMNGDVQVPVFSLLTLLTPSALATFAFHADDATAEDIESLAAMTPDGMAVEDWSTLRLLCQKCSEGVPHAHEEDEIAHDEESRKRQVAVAAGSLEEVENLLAHWQRQGGLAIHSLECVVPSA